MFVAQYGLAGFEIAHAVELEPAQDAADGGPAEACGLRDAQPGPALTAQCLDPLRQLRLGGPTQAERPATTVHKSGLPQLAIACHPFGRGLRAHVGGGCGRRQRASALDHPLGHLFSTPNHRSCILVIVHLVSWITESSQTQLYRSRSDGQSIETSHLVPRSLISHRCRTITISCVGMAPSRRISQRPAPSERSTMVVGSARPVGPPSMMSGIRSPIWSRTAAALVHSAAPCRLAEVAVMGRPRRSTTAHGMAASGTRRATLPVLAVERNGSLVPARTMMVSGPGQKRSASLSSSGSVSRANS